MSSGSRAAGALRFLTALTLATVGFIAFAPPAPAVPGLAIVPTFPSTVTVGDNSDAASVTLTNQSTDGETLSLSDFTLVPSCGTETPTGTDCPTGSEDPGVIHINGNGIGQPGTNCSGISFALSTIDAATGEVEFSAPFQLPPPGAEAPNTCIVDFTFSVLSGPTHDASKAPGEQTAQIAATTTTGPVGTPPVSAVGTSLTTVDLAQPLLFTNADHTAAPGDTIQDFADLTSPDGGPTPTGTVTFELFGPANPTCTGSPDDTSNDPVNASGDAVSDSFTVTEVGVYQWVATYNGDISNSPVTEPCGSEGESTDVQSGTTITTTPSGDTPVGQQITDTATLTGANDPTGTIEFALYAPDECGGEGTAAFTSSVTVSGNGTYTSAPATITMAGDYDWVASYSGDENNAPTSTDCGDETTDVIQATPTLTTTASASEGVGGSLFDTAHLSGAVNASGSLQFELFGPDDPTCANAAVFTTSAEVDGNGDYESASFTPESTGTYEWLVTYSGDDNNASVSTNCGDEPVTVFPPSPGIATKATGNVTVGGTIDDTAILSNGDDPTGTITFSLYGPADPSCTATPVFTSMGTVNTEHIAVSGDFTPMTVGTYLWVASYSGDADNGPTTTECGAETSTVSQAVPVLETAASASVTVGGTITDTATFMDADDPTGTITFDLFGPADTTCSATPLFTSTVPVMGDATGYTSEPFTTNTVGTYNFEASYSGDANNAPIGFGTCGASGESVAVTQASPSLTTSATANAALGNPITDTAALSGGHDPTGTITFSLFGPNAGNCDTTTAFTSSVTVDGNGSYTSAPFTPTAPGSYLWLAHYNGDANNTFANTNCFDDGETSTVAAHLTITTMASPAVTIGGTISDTATVSGGDNPTGMVTFSAYGPDDATCANSPVFTATVPLGAGGQESSGGFVPTEAGTYQWVASYGGDDVNGPATTACGDPDESVAVNPITPTLTTQASATTTLGGTISDTATLAGGFDPTGTITFDVYGPNTTDCEEAAFTSTVPVADGNGNYQSGAFTPTAAGQYRFTAAYNGDSNNNATFSTCGSDTETVTVSPATPTITTTATSAALGGAISDAATLAGGASPTGTITFEAFGPNLDTCNVDAEFTSTDAVTGNGTYQSGPFTPTDAGTYQWRAFYSGDANNAAVDTACFDTGETSTVTASPTITTQASAAVTLGGAISDAATLAGGASPTGTITFDAYGPNDTTDCTGTPVFTATVDVDGDGTYPSGSFTPTALGTYRFVASYSGDDDNSAVATGCTDPGESVAVNAAVPTIVTQASAMVPVGGTISDTATLTGGVAPTGTVTFTVFGPNDATCAPPAAFTSSTPVTGNGTYASGPFTVTAAGTYRFVAAYGGDGGNQAVTTMCNDPNESVVVAPAVPTLATTASAPVPVGGAITDTAALSGGAAPTGSITFVLFGPGDPTCAGSPVFTSTATVDGNGNYTSDPFTTTAAGTYRYQASYSGDANNAPVGLGTCGASGETVAVSSATPTITTHASASVVVGGTISDSAALAGGFAPTGTITFDAFGPHELNGCVNPPAFTSTIVVTGNGTYSSGSFTAAGAGTYEFVTSYSGDANNAAATSPCGAPNERVVVTAATPAVTTQASAPTDLGGAISDTATLTGGDGPTGTITFSLFGADDSSCSGTPVATSTASVDGDGSYHSAPFSPAVPRTYLWMADYSGDANNAAVVSACGDPAESSTVLAVPTITTAASAPVALGGTIADTATLGGGASPTGTITFQVFGPGDDGCDGEPAFTSTVVIDGDGSYTSAAFTPTQPGTYQFVASYNGDDANAPVGTSCGDPGESVAVSRSSPTLSTQASGEVTLGGTVSDVATLAGATAPTGTITFDLYGPNDAECTTTPVFTSMAAVSGNGGYDSGSFTPAAPGTYRFVASYSGDSLNTAAVTGCGDASESVVVQPASPAITTHASASVTVGGSIFDTATLAGGSSPTGTITFTLFGPGNSGCTGAAIVTSTVPVTDGNGSYQSGPFTATIAGTYRFVATYSGDADNNGAASSCTDPNESVVVMPMATTTTTVPVTTTTTTVPVTTTTTTVPVTTTTSVPVTTTTSVPVTTTTVPVTTTTSVPVTTTTVPVTTTTTTTTTLPVTTTTLPRTTTTVPPPTTTAPTTAPTTTVARPTTTVARPTTTVARLPTTVPPTTVPPTTVPPTTVPPTTVPVTTTVAPTTTTTTTMPPTTTTTVGPPTAALRLDRVSTPPGGPAVAVGHACVPNSPVTLSIGPLQVGTAVASPDGSFTANLQLNVPVGQYIITARCGVTLTATIDVVLSSQANPPSSADAVLLILLLLIVGLAWNQLSSH